jgi:hypothetical protein
MAWTTPRTWVNLEIVSHTLMNTHVRDNLQYLKDILDGVQSQTITIKAPTITAMVLRNTGATDNIGIRFMGNTTAVEQWAIGNEISTGGVGRNFDIYDLVGGGNRLRITSTGQVNVSDGSVSAPSRSFLNDTDCGAFRSSADDWGLAAGGSLALGLYKNAGVVQALLGAGSSSAPALAFSGDSDTGLARFNADDIGLVAGTAVVVWTRRVASVTQLGFHGSTPQAKPTVTGAKGGNAALTSLLSALNTIGLITDSSS